MGASEGDAPSMGGCVVGTETFQGFHHRLKHAIHSLRCTLGVCHVSHPKAHEWYWSTGKPDGVVDASALSACDTKQCQNLSSASLL